MSNEKHSLTFSSSFYKYITSSFNYPYIPLISRHLQMISSLQECTVYFHPNDKREPVSLNREKQYLQQKNHHKPFPILGNQPPTPAHPHPCLSYQIKYPPHITYPPPSPPQSKTSTLLFKQARMARYGRRMTCTVMRTGNVAQILKIEFKGEEGLPSLLRANSILTAREAINGDGSRLGSLQRLPHHLVGKKDT